MLITVLQEAAEALLSAQQVGCNWPNITDKVSEYLGRAEALKQPRGVISIIIQHYYYYYYYYHYYYYY